jgi:hypothetical protein
MFPRDDNSKGNENTPDVSNDTQVAVAPSKAERKYIHKNVACHKSLHSFLKDIDWSCGGDDALPGISEDFLQECCIHPKQGMINAFAQLHASPNHDNVQWYKDKLIIYDGRGWTEARQDMIARHLGYIFSILEEKWYDYMTNIRCGNSGDDVIDEEEQHDNELFYYTQIVDDESILFYCKDGLFDYLETLKTS